MSYPELNRRCALAAKVEAVAGTAVAVSFTTNAVRCIGASEPEEFYQSPNDRDEHQTGGLGLLPGAVPAGRCLRFRVQFALQGAGLAYAYTDEDTNTLPEAHPILRAAGMALAVVTGDATYSQTDDPATTITAALRISGKQYTVKGAVCESFAMRCDAGGFPIVDAVIVGVWSAYAETALGTITFDSVALPIFKGASSLLIAAVQPQGRSIQLDHGLQAEPNVSFNATDGVLFYKLVRRRPVLTVNARIPAVSTWDPKGDWAARTARTVDVTIGATENFRVKLDIDNGSYIDVQETPDGEMRNYAAQILCGVHASGELNYIFD